MNLIKVKSFNFPTVKIQLDTWETYMAGIIAARNLRNKLLVDFYIENQEFGIFASEFQSLVDNSDDINSLKFASKKMNLSVLIKNLEAEIQKLIQEDPTLKVGILTQSKSKFGGISKRFKNFTKSKRGKDATSVAAQNSFSKLEKIYEDVLALQSSATDILENPGIENIIDENKKQKDQQSDQFSEEIEVTSRLHQYNDDNSNNTSRDKVFLTDHPQTPPPPHKHSL